MKRAGYAILGAVSLFAARASAQCEPAPQVAPDAQKDDIFGRSAAISNDLMIVGARADDVSFVDQGSAHIYRWNGLTWAHEAQIFASDGDASDFFGSSVSISGDTAVVGAWGDNGSRGAAYVFVRTGGAWVQQAKITAPDAQPNDVFGLSVSVSSSTIVVGAYGVDIGAAVNQGAVYVFTRSAGVWTQQGPRLLASDGQARDRLGYSVATHNGRIVAGAYGADVGANVDQGAAYVFERSGSTWAQTAKLVDAAGAAGDGFGVSVAVEGQTAIVGVPFDDSAAGADAGSACVYFDTGGSWISQGKLVASDAGAGDFFGWSVGATEDRVAVGSVLDDVGTHVDQGSCYVFDRTGSAWEQSAILTASAGDAGDHLGDCVALHELAVLGGAPYAVVNGKTGAGEVWVFGNVGGTWVGPDRQLLDPAGVGGDGFGASLDIRGKIAAVGGSFDNLSVGSVAVYERTGTQWVYATTLTGSDTIASDSFGAAVAVGDNTIAVGAPFATVGTVGSAGAVYVFEKVAGVWTQKAKLSASNAAAGDSLGFSVDIDGDTVVAGAIFDDTGMSAGVNQGSAYVFVKSGGVWAQQAQLVPPVTADSANAGRAVAISGNTAAVGSWFDDVGPNNNQGTANIFTRSGTVWSHQALVSATDGAANDSFGCAISIDGDTLLVGANRHDVGPNIDQGEAYIFTRTGTSWAQSQVLTSPAGAAGDYFGFSVSLHNGAALVGAWTDDVGAASNAGSASLYFELGSQWVYRRTLVAPDTLADDGFGVACATDGATALVGASGDDIGAQGNQGSAWLFDTPLECDPAAWNIDTGTVYGSISASFPDVEAGHHVFATPAAFSVAGPIVFPAPAFTLESTDNVIVPRENSITLSGGSSLRAAADGAVFAGGGLTVPGGTGATVAGTLVFPCSATLSVSGATLTLDGEFDCAIDDNSRFDGRTGVLRMTGDSYLEAMSKDVGDSTAGLDPSLPASFPWGGLTIDPGVTVDVGDDHDNDLLGDGSCEAVYVGRLTIGDGATLSIPSCKVYYLQIANSGTVDHPENLVPIDGCFADFNADGFVSGEDFDDYTAAFEAGDVAADFDRNGFVNGEDFDGYVAAFQNGC